ncbi:MAG: hypothetical protein ACK6DR_05910 [Gemmatimonas sp.]|jgi:hypothetical protein|uniref:hypothetical protein n=1 Tax=Gemmatimonas sp. TaxID=1962908 RepID=UPI0022CB72E4|nr:hypothetical protein [Gemmatimonas sp.]MCA2984700.1 hypothetical protein [Gemmatimonas sp.]MCA2985963.1 hypothetical protein [Gemmatimonas sp.]MCA2996821.1 hypothetical protein [Gemmatimonas sp.]MCE2953828.1 hypothetical protein [Gemmatimonas sp.]MCZ8013573.1 hypothetical protein [Gemmatimonas sp.]
MSHVAQRRARVALLAGIVLALWFGVFTPRRGTGSDDRVREAIAAVPHAPESRVMPRLSAEEERRRFAVVALLAAGALVGLALLGRGRRA